MFVDDSQLPLVKISFPGKPLEEADLVQYLAEFEAIFERKTKFLLFIDTTQLLNPRPAFFKRQISFLKERKPLFAKYAIASAVILDKPFVKTLVDTLLFFYTPASEVKTFPNATAAMNWAHAKLFASTPLDAIPSSTTKEEVEIENNAPSWKMYVREFIGELLCGGGEGNIQQCSEDPTGDFFAKCEQLLVSQNTGPVRNAYDLLINDKKFLSENITRFAKALLSSPGNESGVYDTLLMLNIAQCVQAVLEEPEFKSLFSENVNTRSCLASIFVAFNLLTAPELSTAKNFALEMKLASEASIMEIISSCSP
jgi:hypothetical protein